MLSLFAEDTGRGRTKRYLVGSLIVAAAEFNPCFMKSYTFNFRILLFGY